jgi:hypothetical protein
VVHIANLQHKKQTFRHAFFFASPYNYMASVGALFLAIYALKIKTFRHQIYFISVENAKLLEEVMVSQETPYACLSLPTTSVTILNGDLIKWRLDLNLTSRN